MAFDHVYQGDNSNNVFDAIQEAIKQGYALTDTWWIDGNGGNDVLSGANGRDYMNGDVGADTMAGRQGNDVYLVDNYGDVVTENANEGIDLVESYIYRYTLPKNVENLELNGNASYGYGNNLNNLLIGRNETNKVDRLYGKEGNDNLYGHGGSDYLHGQAGRDKLLGGDDNDYLFGGTGQDYMDGGAGSDIVNYSDHDAWIRADLATDTVKVQEYIDDFYIEYTETIKNIEGVVGSDRGNDYIYGDAQQNTLAGRKGDDRLFGRGGNDTLLGEDGTDYLNGGEGNDTLRGGREHDIFAFSKLSEGIDTIVDFSVRESDSIQISKSGFGASSHDQFIYNAGSGVLYFDASPFDDVAPTAFAVLSNKPADFSIVGAISFVD